MGGWPIERGGNRQRGYGCIAQLMSLFTPFAEIASIALFIERLLKYKQAQTINK